MSEVRFAAFQVMTAGIVALDSSGRLWLRDESGDWKLYQPPDDEDPTYVGSAPPGEPLPTDSLTSPPDTGGA